MKKIIERRQANQHPRFSNYPPLLQRIYAARKIRSEQELRYDLELLPAPTLLKNMDAAVALLDWALRQQKRIVVIGDFDADGATSCALALRGLQALGFENVGFLVPNRFEYGYGLTPEIVTLSRQQKPDLIITVDNGISSHAGVAAANQAGIKVLITDHHLPPPTLPNADVIINPNQTDDSFPSKCIAGVGVMFYVLAALRSYLRENNWFSSANRSEPNLAQWLDIVALGTVADVVPLDHCNRILVTQGLNRIRKGQTIVGIRALLEQAKRNKPGIGVNDLGFGIAPQLNAAGRLQDMSLGVECLLTDDLNRARELAQRLAQLNRERRKIEATMADEAFATVEETLNRMTSLPCGMCLYEPQWHQGVIGIVASRVKERCHRPVFAFAPANEKELKGSGRSIEGVHLRDVLSAIADQHPELLDKFGGHAMAAGLSLAKDKFPAFQSAFEQELQNWIEPAGLRNVILTDGPVKVDEMDIGMAQLIEQAGPWGQGFPEPVFDGVFEVRNTKLLKDTHLKLALRMPGIAFNLDAIAFNFHQGKADPQIPPEGKQLRLAFRMEVNEFRQQRQLQLNVLAIAD